MELLVKRTFEISDAAAETLRELKFDLEKKRLPVKQRHIIERLIQTAKLSTLARYFEEAIDERIGESQEAARERRRAQAAKLREKKAKAATKARRS